ncbi:MAG: hypothetical protein LBQ14_06830 [Treponema sp.]|nr:hypothetical protein [Treponema sp.]
MITMILAKLKPAGLILLIMLMFLGSCGDLHLGSIFPGEYEVSALVNKADISSRPVISRDDLITPYFINPIVKDPDLAGLAVFFEGSGGAESGRVYYSISGGKGEGKERAIQVSRLDKPFPAFSIPPDLELGRYTLVFQVMRRDNVSSRIERPLYYLGTADLELEDVRIALPDGETMLVPPGTTVMLEAGVSVQDEDPAAGLEPYIVWYNGRTIIGEGPVYGGIHRFMWQTPEQTGFRTIRAELLPFNPGETYLSAGKFKELSLPVSSKSERTPSFVKEGETLTHWYRFRGDLLDLKTGQALIPQNSGEPQWRSWGNVYGMVLGAGDAYSLPAFTGEADRGYGRITCRFVPLGEGPLIRTSFTVDRSARTVDLDLSISGGGLVLSLGTDSQTGETIGLEVPVADSPADRGFITASVNFQYEPGVFTADLTLDGTEAPGRSLAFPGRISGGTITLGAGKGPETAAGPGEDAGITAVPAAEAAGPLALLDELLTAYSPEPL